MPIRKTRKVFELGRNMHPLELFNYDATIGIIYQFTSSIPKNFRLWSTPPIRLRRFIASSAHWPKPKAVYWTCSIYIKIDYADPELWSLTIAASHPFEGRIDYALELW